MRPPYNLVLDFLCKKGLLMLHEQLNNALNINETSDAEPDQPVELHFDFTLEEDNNNSDNDFIVELQCIKPNILETLINNAKKSNV
ncbi:8586_t:CDS:2 [Acaulospora morrowiae]|uniref:8586_t:CDS:1 n=1 Tax=Acaulospora morrowiae TaxID=94023 RepID=A0A9N9G2A7_9GLOM|nr:8586_t:CDS:2 [Acaulospora morrowiae]